jgi:hypothetical protein
LATAVVEKRVSPLRCSQKRELNPVRFGRSDGSAVWGERTGKSNRRSFDFVTRKVRELLRSG